MQRVVDAVVAVVPSTDQDEVVKALEAYGILVPADKPPPEPEPFDEINFDHLCERDEYEPARFHHLDRYLNPPKPKPPKPKSPSLTVVKPERR